MNDKVVCGAFPSRDGIDQAGSTIRPKSEIPDGEAYEQLYPILYLYRRSALNGGHGEFRGGNGIVFGWVGHGSSDQLASTICMASSFSSQSGMCGGHRGETGTHYGVSDSNIRSLNDERAFPSPPVELRELTGDRRVLPAKSVGFDLGEGVVIESSVYGGGGFGDPLHRDPERVADDVKKGAVTSAIARLGLRRRPRRLGPVDTRRPPSCAVRPSPVGCSAPRPRRRSCAIAPAARVQRAESEAAA